MTSDLTSEEKKDVLELLIMCLNEGGYKDMAAEVKSLIGRKDEDIIRILGVMSNNANMITLTKEVFEGKVRLDYVMLESFRIAGMM